MTKTEKEGIRDYLKPLLAKYGFKIKSIMNDSIIIGHVGFSKLKITGKVSKIDWTSNESSLRSLFCSSHPGGGEPRTNIELAAMNYAILVIMNYMGGIPQAESTIGDPHDIADWNTIKGYYEAETP
jgi:hypothetical protein